MTKTNIQLVRLIEELKKQASIQGVNIWSRIAEDLDAPTRNRGVINIYKINKYAKADETVIVPGKVLSVGELDHKVNIAALNFSGQAVQKILKAQGKVLSIYELMKINPKGKGVRILI